MIDLIVGPISALNIFFTFLDDFSILFFVGLGRGDVN